MSEGREAVSARSPADWSIARVLRWATEDFQSRGIPNPRLDAELLLSHTLELDRVHLIIESRRVLSAEELAAFRSSIKRRRAGEPIAYILGRREFFGLSISVDARVLIPRPDTETLVEVALRRTRAQSMYGRALDLCTGSGCVALAFAKARPTWRVTGLDLSSEALGLARYNAARVGAIWGVRFIASNLFEKLEANERFELLTANPPYIASEEIDALDPGIRDFEPRLALDGGSDGLRVIRRVVQEAPIWLASGGLLAVEVGAEQGKGVRELFAKAGFGAIEGERDYGGHERIISGRLAERPSS
jgi:release factor glutamine methyltransferase